MFAGVPQPICASVQRGESARLNAAFQEFELILPLMSCLAINVHNYGTDRSLMHLIEVTGALAAGRRNGADYRN
jgi:hypothetical protein